MEISGMSNQEKVVIVTGAGSGIGKAVALAFLKTNHQVVLAGRRENALEETLQESGEFAKNGLAISTDVADPNSVRKLFDTTKQKFGRLDVIFNNAGVNAPPVLLEDLTDEQWTNVVDINFNGMF
jgi:NADP-dependent 3-hydroxy acid dehydrogenase YdfG